MFQLSGTVVVPLQGPLDHLLHPHLPLQRQRRRPHLPRNVTGPVEPGALRPQGPRGGADDAQDARHGPGRLLPTSVSLCSVYVQCDVFAKRTLHPTHTYDTYRFSVEKTYLHQITY